MRRAADAAGVSAGDAAGRFSDSDGSFAPRARHISLAQRKIRWRSPTAIRLSRDMDVNDVVQVQRERLQSLPVLRQLPWPCEPGALNGSLLCPGCLNISRAAKKTDLPCLAYWSRHFVKSSITSRLPR
jgi:hypothetical protein